MFAYILNSRIWGFNSNYYIILPQVSIKPLYNRVNTWVFRYFKTEVSSSGSSRFLRYRIFCTPSTSDVRECLRPLLGHSMSWGPLYNMFVPGTSGVRQCLFSWVTQYPEGTVLYVCPWAPQVWDSASSVWSLNILKVTVLFLCSWAHQVWDSSVW